MIQLKKHSGIYTLKSKQVLPISLEDAWQFFSSPKNLKVITPDHMGFDITSENETDSMYAGQIITYKVSPLLGIKMNWVTEITQVVEHQFFIDEQRFGPYAMWHHEHHFTPIKNGTEMNDIVSYKLPVSFISNIFHNFLVKPKLLEIFSYREKKIKEIFGW